ncbi:hypothetical protein X777_04359, partial [Ooceraea biroi]
KPRGTRGIRNLNRKSCGEVEQERERERQDGAGVIPKCGTGGKRTEETKGRKKHGRSFTSAMVRESDTG